MRLQSHPAAFSLQEPKEEEPVDDETKRALLQEDRASLLSAFHQLQSRYFISNTNSIQYGLAVFGPSILVSYSEATDPADSHIIVVDPEIKRVLRVDELDLASLEKNAIIDLNDDGSRWEGDIFENMQFGWGKEYDSEGNLRYEGFCFGGKYECYGTSYYDCGVIEYVGNFVFGMRFGMGTLHDRLSKLVYEGTWICDVPSPNPRLCITRENALQHTIHSSVTHLSFDRCCLFKKEHSLILDGFPRLKFIVFGKYSFGEWSDEQKQQCVIRNCASLRRVFYKAYSFRTCDELRLESDCECGFEE